ncbi:hypothetical protein PR003_g1169 [Phytophthora rubi]|uniref:Uncharacterized protein n=1 Tax=Phytophthora rubi TaxID=129364 RepID=A0A6A4G605_9STRA|nr:hypothetical protein PR003_g1169 [Phytophthora rubi]
MVGGAGKEPRYKMTAQERLLCREALLSDRHARRIRRSSSTTGAEGERHKKASRKEGAKRTTVAMGLRGALEAAPAPGAALSVAEAKDADVESTPSAEAKGAGVESAPSAEAQDADEDSAPSPEAQDAPAEDAPDAAGPAISQLVTAVPAISQPVTARPAISQPVTAGPAISQPVTAAEVIADMVTAVVDDTATEQPGPGRNVRKPRRAILEDVSAGGMVVPAKMWQLRCTYLNSDEDMSVEEDREDQDSSDDGDEDDWDIGELTDEETDDGGEDLPESVCNSVAQSKKAIAMMRMHGWEYGTLCCPYTT